MNHMKDKKSKAKRTVSGVITVEMTYIVPMIFFIFVMIIYTVFYYHDKNILIGAAGETAVVAAQMTRKPETEGQTDLTEFYRERIQGKLILFPRAEVTVEESEKLRLMYAFDIEKYPDDKMAPIQSYSGKAQVFKRRFENPPVYPPLRVQTKNKIFRHTVHRNRM